MVYQWVIGSELVHQPVSARPVPEHSEIIIARTNELLEDEPLQRAIASANRNSSLGRVISLKQNRVEIMGMLEPVYQRIIQAAKSLNDFIKVEKGIDGIFDAGLFSFKEYPLDDGSQYCTAMSLLAK